MTYFSIEKKNPDLYYFQSYSICSNILKKISRHKGYGNTGLHITVDTSFWNVPELVLEALATM
jgi:hypothetical protein